MHCSASHNFQFSHTTEQVPLPTWRISLYEPFVHFQPFQGKYILPHLNSVVSSEIHCSARHNFQFSHTTETRMSICAFSAISRKMYFTLFEQCSFRPDCTAVQSGLKIHCSASHNFQFSHTTETIQKIVIK